MSHYDTGKIAFVISTMTEHMNDAGDWDRVQLLDRYLALLDWFREEKEKDRKLASLDPFQEARPVWAPKKIGTLKRIEKFYRDQDFLQYNYDIGMISLEDIENQLMKLMAKLSKKMRENEKFDDAELLDRQIATLDWLQKEREKLDDET